MSIKYFRLLWIKLQIENRRFLNISLPIPLYIFQELFDSFLDLLTVAYFFAPKMPDQNSSSRINIYSVKLFTAIVMKLLDSLNENEPYNIVDVSTDKVKVLIKIR